MARRLALALCAAVSIALPPPLPLFIPGQPSSWNIPIYRIPSLVRTARGTLVAVAEARTTSLDCTYKWLAFRRSVDNGTTWSEPAEIYGRALTPPQGAGNPVLLYDAVTSTIFLHGSVNSPRHCNPTLWTFAIDDGGSDGLTWGPARNISASLGPWGGATPGPGAGAQIPLGAPNAGRLIVPAHYGAYRDVISWYSDDHGSSWVLSKTALPGLDEVAVAALPNGDLVLNARTDHANASCDCRAVTTSSDGGVTWELPVRFDAALIEPVCQGTLAYMAPLKDAPSGALFFANPASRTARVDLTVRRSDDGGATWPYSLLLAPGDEDGLGYSCIASGPPIVEDDGTESGAILFEAPGGTIAFMRFPVVLPPAPPPPAPPAVIPATAAVWVGRNALVADPSGAVSFDMPGVTASFSVANATFFTAIFTSACPLARLEAGIDGEALDTHSKDSFNVLPATPSSPYRISLATGLDPSVVHTLAIRVGIEARWAGCTNVTSVTLAGVESDGVHVSPPPPPLRTLEFIGDSITAGFGTVPPCAGGGGTTASREDASRTAALGVICPALGAACSIIAVSGDTVITPAGGAAADKPPIPLVFGRSLTYATEPLWDFSAHDVPSALVLNLGTNDVADASFNSSYVGALSDFLVSLSSRGGVYAPRPPPRTLCWCGPMVDTYCDAMAAAVAAASARGADVAFLGAVNATLDGCDGHPGQLGQREVGEVLLPLIRAHMGW